MKIYSLFLPGRNDGIKVPKMPTHKGTRKENSRSQTYSCTPPKKTHMREHSNCSRGGEFKNSPIVLWFLELTQPEKSRSEELTNHFLKYWSPRKFHPLFKCTSVLFTSVSLTSHSYFLLILLWLGYGDKSIYLLPIQWSELRFPCK